MENTDSTIVLKNANEHRKELLETIEKYITSIQSAAQTVENDTCKPIADNIIKAHSQNINYIPDKSILSDFIKIVKTLNGYQLLLQEPITDENALTYPKISKIEKELDSLLKSLKNAIESFQKKNKTALDSAYWDKDKAVRHLKDLDIEFSIVNDNNIVSIGESILSYRKERNIKFPSLRKRKLKKIHAKQEKSVVDMLNSAEELSKIKEEIKEAKIKLQEVSFNPNTYKALPDEITHPTSQSQTGQTPNISDDDTITH